MTQCKNCKHFEKMSFHKAYGGGDTGVGRCYHLTKLLIKANVELFLKTDAFIVFENFGCVLSQEKT